MSDEIERDFRPLEDRPETQMLPGRSIEVVQGFDPRGAPAHVLFDFDGTLSLIREGWADIMVPMMVDYLREVSPDESPSDLGRLCSQFVMDLTGKQTIYQMMRLADEIRLRGGAPLDPLAYKQEYHRRLMVQIEQRREGLRYGQVQAAEFLVPGSYELLRELIRRGATLYLASGTDEHYVREEVELLGLGHYFGSRIFGAVDDYRSFSKAMVIQRILAENQLNGASLLGFGDGFVEIRNVYDAGGTAIGVASDEADRSGRVDVWKRERLLGAGAHVVIPDFAEASALVDWLWSSEESH